MYSSLRTDQRHNGDGDASGGGGPGLAARAQRAAHFSCAAGAKILPRGHQNTSFSMKKRDQTCPRKAASAEHRAWSSRRALVSSPLCLVSCCSAAAAAALAAAARVPARLLPCFLHARRAWRCHMSIADMYALARKLCAFVLRVSAACRRAAAAYGNDY